MKPLTLSILLSFFSNSLFAQYHYPYEIKFKNDSVKKSLIKKIIKISIFDSSEYVSYVMEYNEASKIASYCSDPPKGDCYTFEYNKCGKIVKEWQSEKETQKLKHQYFYENEKLIKEIELRTFERDTSYTSIHDSLSWIHDSTIETTEPVTILYTYLKNSYNKIAIRKLDTIFRSTILLDKQGRVVEEIATSFEENKKRGMKRTIIYNTLGLIESIQTITLPDHSQYYYPGISNFNYDKRGRLVNSETGRIMSDYNYQVCYPTFKKLRSNIRYNKYGIRKEVNRYEYLKKNQKVVNRFNKIGNIIKSSSKSIRKDGTKYKNKVKTRYLYDSNNNWIEREIESNAHIDKRIITYYD